MTLTSARAGFGTWAGSAKPAKPHGDDKTLHVASSAAHAYIHTPKIATSGSTVVSAPLTIYAKGASSGTRTLTLRRITEDWKARTLDWNNRPAVTDVGMVTVTVGALADKAPITFNVAALLQPMVSGTTQNLGWRISTTGSDHTFYSTESGVKNPTITVEYVEGPGAPTKLRPGGGLVGVAQPTLTATYTGADDMVSYQVQADPSANEATPAYDTGVVPATDLVHPLAGTTFNQLPATGSTTSWRIRATDTAGITSDWSDWVDITRDDKGTLTLNNPAASPNNFVTEPTPPFLFTYPGMTSFELVVADGSDPNLIVHSSELVTGTVGAYTMPLAIKSKKPLLVTAHGYNLRVRAYDAKQRQGSLAVGDEPYAEASRAFTVNDTASAAAPASVSVAQSGATPAVLFTFTRTTAPDGFVILRDGVEIDGDVLPGDVFTTGITYVYRDWTAHPGTAHSYTAKAVVNGVQSQPSAARALTGGTAVVDLWVIDPETGRYFALWGDDVANWQQTEVSTEYRPVGSRAGFRITQSLNGLSGTFAGELWPQSNKTLDALVDDLWRMKEAGPSSEDFRLVAPPYLNIPVRVSNLTCTLSQDEVPGQPRRAVSFEFAQTGEFEFEGV